MILLTVWALRNLTKEQLIKWSAGFIIIGLVGWLITAFAAGMWLSHGNGFSEKNGRSAFRMMDNFDENAPCGVPLKEWKTCLEENNNEEAK
ncbi:hypothetical protein COY07_03130 [Candidatus Peregrinibacteria bacterium CG_4_10_14_0_2_um_filter_43_11]|nr:MAG: hypothetical protein COY07_03130 [Candidatus Peregrinibacteria bacterium CG_4_10_14_0_2_um_filter_43_11]